MKIELDDKCYFDSVFTTTIHGYVVQHKYRDFIHAVLTPLLRDKIYKNYNFSKLQPWNANNISLIDFFPKKGELSWVLTVFKCFLFFKYLKKIGEFHYHGWDAVRFTI